MKRRMKVLLAGLVASLAFAGSASAAGVLSPNDRIGWPVGGVANAKGWVIVIHGGGWYGGANLMAPDLAVAQVLNAHRYGTLTIDYRSGGPQSVEDTQAAYDWLAHALPALYPLKTVPPICAWGESAGGHLALMLSVTRPVSCVISQAGPTNLLTFPDELADGKPSTATYNQLVIPAFTSNPDELAEYSPALWCPNPSVRYLLGASAGDQIVPQAQMADFSSVCPQAQTVTLDANPADGPLVHWTHAFVTQAASTAWLNDMWAFLP